MSRVRALTDETKAVILSAIREGNYKATACALAGVHRDTVHGWEQRGEAGEEPFATFLDELREAEAVAESTLLRGIRTATGAIPEVKGPDMWSNMAWMLERRWPKRWAARVRTAVTEEIDAFTDRLQRRLDDATYRRVLDAAREDAPGEGAGDAKH